MAIQEVQADLAGSSRHVHAGLRRDHEVRAREEPARAQGARRSAVTTTAASPRASAAAGHKKRYRVDRLQAHEDRRARDGDSAIEYDPNRSARIALLQYADGEKAYILAPAAPQRRRPGDRGEHRRHQAGQLAAAALHPDRHRRPRRRAQDRPRRADRPLGRHASVTLMAKEGDWATLRMPSGEMRRVHIDCRATVGVIGNSEHGNIQWGKAGRMRWLGIRPHNRGVSMNPVDHPMGGGEGRSLRWPSPVHPVGHEDQGPQDPSQQADRAVHHPPPQVNRRNDHAS